MIDLVAICVAAAVLVAIGFLWGRAAEHGSVEQAVRYLRADNARLRSLLAATERELDAERSRARAPVIRVSPWRGGAA